MGTTSKLTEEGDYNIWTRGLNLKKVNVTQAGGVFAVRRRLEWYLGQVGCGGKRPVHCEDSRQGMFHFQGKIRQAPALARNSFDFAIGILFQEFGPGP